ncbi:MAG: protein translocase subunit SecF [Actinomycetota bacterium]
MSVSTAIATFRGNRVPHFKLVEHKRRWFAFSGLLIAISLFGIFFKHLNLSIDFEGGALLQYENQTGVTTEDVRTTMAEFGRGDAEVQVIGGTQVSVRTTTLNPMSEEQRGSMIDALATQAGVSPDEINRQDVGPTWGEQISRKALQALIVFLVLVTGYIALRFEWKMALAAQAALFHDLIVTAGVYALVGREVTPETVIAILTILGYSLYDTVVIFDRIKENAGSAALVAKEGYSNVVNLSLNETLMRSLNTSLATALPVLALLLFGGETLKDFAFALLVGLLLGAYSSIFLAAPLVALLKEREPKYRQMRLRAAARDAAGKGPAHREPAVAGAVASERPSLVAVPGGGSSESSKAKKKKKRKTTAAKRRRR